MLARDDRDGHIARCAAPTNYVVPKEAVVYTAVTCAETVKPNNYPARQTTAVVYATLGCVYCRHTRVSGPNTGVKVQNVNKKDPAEALPTRTKYK